MKRSNVVMTILGVCMLNFTVSSYVLATPMKSAGRYSQVAMEPTKENRDPLRQLVEINFPKHIKTVEGAVRFVTEPTGYRLPENKEFIDSAFVELGEKPLPISQRTLKGSVSDVLSALVGGNFVLVRDDVRRLIVLDYIGREW